MSNDSFLDFLSDIPLNKFMNIKCRYKTVEPSYVCYQPNNEPTPTVDLINVVVGMGSDSFESNVLYSIPI